MKKIILGTISLLVLGILSYYSGFLYTERQYEEKKPIPVKQIEEPQDIQDITNTQDDTETIEKPLHETSVPPYPAVEEYPTQKVIDVQYYLVEEFGYVNIYLQDKKTVYEFTDIKIGDLPHELQDEICTGKGVANEQELYDFLENYSS